MFLVKPINFYLFVLMIIPAMHASATLLTPRVPGIDSQVPGVINGRVNLCEGDKLIIEDDLRGAGGRLLPGIRGLRMTFLTEEEGAQDRNPVSMGGRFNGNLSPFQQIYDSPSPSQKISVEFESDPLLSNESFREYSIRVQTSSSVHKSHTIYGNERIQIRVGGPLKTVMLKAHISKQMNSIMDEELFSDLSTVNQIWKQACIQFQYIQNPDGSIDRNILEDENMNQLIDGSVSGHRSNLALFGKTAAEFPDLINLFFVSKISASTASARALGSQVVLGVTPFLQYCVIGVRRKAPDRGRILAHEIGHFLLGQYGHPEGQWAVNRLMYYGLVSGSGSLLTKSEVTQARKHKF